MKALQSPLDALVFDVTGFGILTVVSSLWTWLALITAAVSFWRIRSAGAGGAAARLLKSEQPTPYSVDVDGNRPQSVSETSLPELATEPCNSLAPASSPFPFPTPSVFEDNRATKGKFLAYYGDVRGSDGKGDDDGELTEVVQWGYAGSGICGGEWGESWERVLRIRMGKIGWYRNQDLAAINGNVVRLWDGATREKHGSSCLVW
uniref:Uncharacterized protein n=1 Tax=Rhizophora mucronata TaxID=61149 RepID=A0A2P2QMI1_RHIMU